MQVTFSALASPQKQLKTAQPKQPLFGSSYREEEGDTKKFYSAKPNKVVIGAVNRLAWAVSKLIDFDVYVDHKELNQLKKLIASEDGVIITPNHSHALDSTTLSRGLVGRGVPVSIMGADVVFNRFMGLNGQLLRRYGMFSVARGGTDKSQTYAAVNDVLQNQNRALLMFPEGYVSHSNMQTQELKEGAAMFALHTVDNTDTNVKIVPVSFYYDYENKEKMISRIDKTLNHLEEYLLEKAQEEDADPDEIQMTAYRDGATLSEKTMHLLDYMTRSREQAYAEKYGTPILDSADPYERLEEMRDNVLQALYDKYEVERDMHAPEDMQAKRLMFAIKTAGDEETGEKPEGWRKAKQKVTRTISLPFRLFAKSTQAEWASDIKTLKDIVNLTMYPRGYFESSLLDQTNSEEEFVLINRLVEQVAVLSRDVGGRYTPLFRNKKLFRTPSFITVVRAFRKGDISANLKIDMDNLIDVRATKEAHPEMDKRELRSHITQQIQDRLNQNLEDMEKRVIVPIQDRVEGEEETSAEADCDLPLAPPSPSDAPVEEAPPAPVIYQQQRFDI